MTSEQHHHRYRLLSIFLLALSTWGCSPGQGAAKETNPSSTVVISAIGDSITLGVGSPSGGYPQRLQAMLDQAGCRAVVKNLGVSGEKAYQTRQRFAQILAQSDMVLLMIGFNDLTRPDECPKPLGCRTLTYIENMLDMAARKRITVFLGTITPPKPHSIRSWADQTINRFNDELRKIAAKHGVPLVETHSILTKHAGEDLYADHAHPNARGYERLAECWYEALVVSGLLLKEE